MIMRVLLSDFALLCKCSGNVGHVTISVTMVLIVWRMFRPTSQSSATSQNEHHTLWDLPTDA